MSKKTELDVQSKPTHMSALGALLMACLCSFSRDKIEEVTRLAQQISSAFESFDNNSKLLDAFTTCGVLGYSAVCIKHSTSIGKGKPQEWKVNLRPDSLGSEEFQPLSVNGERLPFTPDNMVPQIQLDPGDVGSFSSINLNGHYVMKGEISTSVFFHSILLKRLEEEGIGELPVVAYEEKDFTWYIVPFFVLPTEIHREEDVLVVNKAKILRCYYNGKVNPIYVDFLKLKDYSGKFPDTRLLVKGFYDKAESFGKFRWWFRETYH